MTPSLTPVAERVLPPAAFEPLEDDLVEVDLPLDELLPPALAASDLLTALFLLLLDPTTPPTTAPTITQIAAMASRIQSHFLDFFYETKGKVSSAMASVLGTAHW